MAKKKNSIPRLQPKDHAIRALGVILPGLLFASFLLKTPLKMAIGIAVAWCIAFLISKYTKFGRFGYTLLTSVCVGYLFSVVKATTWLLADRAPLLPNLHKIFITPELVSIIFLGLLIPAWALLYFIDIMICNSFTKK